MMHKGFDVKTVRNDFPVLERRNRGQPIAFIDNAATSQKPISVIDAVAQYYRESNSNVHRGVYELAEESENLYHHARKLSANTSILQKEKLFSLREQPKV